MKIRKIVPCLTLLTSMLAQTAIAADSTEFFSAGTGKTKFGALLQSWMLNDTTPTGDATPKFNFRLRRAELKFGGTVAENSRWFVMIDPAKNFPTGAVAATNDNKILQDLGVAFELFLELELIAGQFKTPTTAEGLDSSGELLLPERSYSGKTFGDKREPGLMLAWSKDIWKFSGMIYNGQNKSNVDDIDNNKDLSFRVDVNPVEMLKLGAFTTAGNCGYGTKGRWGGNARVAVDQLLVRGEVVYARDSGVKSIGWEADAAYSINERFQPAVRVDGFDNSTFSSTAINLGINYYLSKHNAKVQAAYTILDNMTGANGSYAPANPIDGSLFVVAFQAMI